jgi:hypothetical protein
LHNKVRTLILYFTTVHVLFEYFLYYSLSQSYHSPPIMCLGSIVTTRVGNRFEGEDNVVFLLLEQMVGSMIFPTVLAEWSSSILSTIHCHRLD